MTGVTVMTVGLALLEVVLVVDGHQPRFTIDERVAVVEHMRPDAEVCLVHLHGNEVLARDVMLEQLKRKNACANAIYLDDVRSGLPWGDDRIPVPTTKIVNGSSACYVNPNRVWTAAGIDARIEYDCDDDPLAKRELKRFVDERLAPALARCRGSERAAHALPVIAFHNNTNVTVEDLDVLRADVVTGRKNDILLVTRVDDYERLSALQQFTVALQNAPPADDGSLSVHIAQESGAYINVEAQIAPSNKRINRAMAEAALRSVGGYVCGDVDDARSR